MSVSEECWVYYNAGVQKDFVVYQYHMLFALMAVCLVIFMFYFFIVRPYLKRGEKE